MERYSEYKDSGVQWLGEIPSHWEFCRFKNIASLITTPSNSSHKIGLENIEGGTGKYLLSESEFEGNGIQFEVGDIVYGKLRPYLQKVWKATFSGNAVGDFFVFRPNYKIDRNYLLYLMLSKGFTDDVNSSTYGAKMPRVSSDYIMTMRCGIPPFSEQQSIAAYLDTITGKIDKAIAQQQKMIDLLNERKQIIINHAVTKGLNPNVSMKDNGMEWIGQMPEHWEQLPLKYVFEIRNGYTPSKNDKSYWTNGTIRWYRMEDIRKSGRILNESIQYVTHKAVNGKGLFKAGSYIMAICTASIGEHAMLIADSLANQQFANFNIRKSLVEDFDPMYLFYFMYVVGDFCRNNANSTCFQYVDMEALKRFPILKPSKEEQKCIVAYLDKGLKKLNTALEQTKDRIALLQERKQIIINEVVTGKVKVS